MSEEDFAKRMVDLVNQRNKYFAEERAKAKRSKPMTQSQLRIYMSIYLKNQGTWKLSQLKKLKFEEIKEEFDKLGNGTDKVYMSLGAMLKEISREDLTELYRILMKRYGTEGPTDDYERVFWENLKIMFDAPLSTDLVWSLPERKYPLSANVCQTMLKMKLLDGKMNEDCYKLLKMIEKQAGVRK
ncbi:hypothetical protein Tco_0695138 [Tanacetum coccineum]